MKQRIIKYYCDRCKREITGDGIYKSVSITSEKLPFGIMMKRASDNDEVVDLCNECQASFVNWWIGGE